MKTHSTKHTNIQHISAVNWLKKIYELIAQFSKNLSRLITPNIIVFKNIATILHSIFKDTNVNNIKTVYFLCFFNDIFFYD